MSKKSIKIKDATPSIPPITGSIAKHLLFFLQHQSLAVPANTTVAHVELLQYLTAVVNADPPSQQVATKEG